MKVSANRRCRLKPQGKKPGKFLRERNVSICRLQEIVSVRRRISESREEKMDKVADMLTMITNLYEQG